MDSHSSLTPSEPDWIAINGYKWSIYTMDYQMFRNGLTTSARPTSSVEVGTTNSVAGIWENNRGDVFWTTCHVENWPKTALISNHNRKGKCWPRMVWHCTCVSNHQPASAGTSSTSTHRKMTQNWVITRPPPTPHTEIKDGTSWRAPKIAMSNTRITAMIISGNSTTCSWESLSHSLATHFSFRTWIAMAFT